MMATYRRRKISARQRAKNRRLAKRYTPPRPFTLMVEYPGVPDSEFEKLLAAQVGPHGQSEGSGYSFVDGMRDVEFGFMSRGVAVAAAKRVKKIFKRKVVVKVTGRIWP